MKIRHNLFIYMFILFCLSLFPFELAAKQKVLWQIGAKDNSSSEFAFHDVSYKDYALHYKELSVLYEVGKSKASDLPYVMPGPSDAWNQNRNTQLIVDFGVKKIKESQPSVLRINLLEVNPYDPPVMSVTLNDYKTQIHVPAGKNVNYLDDKKVVSENLYADIEIPGTALKEGNNRLIIRSDSGSWAVFDNLSFSVDSYVLPGKNIGEISLMDATAVPSLFYGKDSCLYQSVKLTLLNSMAKPQRLKILVDNRLSETRELECGVRTIEIGVPETKTKREVKVGLYLDDKLVAERIVESFPVKKWTVFLVQHTHTDIGYTKRQTEILTEHLRYIDYAVEYCELTQNYSDDAKFRWTCESAWAVSEYLKSRPKEQIDRLKKYIDNGQIEVSAMYFNMSEIVDENALKSFLAPVRQFKQMGFPVKIAMQNDVNGVAWSLSDYLPELGVCYLWIGSNATRAILPFKLPTIYRWESPSGKSMIAYRADHYHTGNYWGIEKADPDFIQSGMFKYLGELEDKNYPFDAISVQYSGYFTDNSPPSYKESKLIEEWNKKYAFPKLKSALASEFMDYVVQNYSDKLETFRTAYPDWWTDGFGSAARETAAARETHSDMITIEGLLSMAKAKGKILPVHIMENIRRVYEKVLFYDEHTFGAAESLIDPSAENSMVQWAEKGAYVWEAKKSGKMLYETAAGLLQNDLRRGKHPTLTFFNTMPFNRSQMHTIYIDFEVIPHDKSFRLIGEDGKELKVQPVRERREGTYFTVFAENIPAMGYRTFDMIIEDKPWNIRREMENLTNIIENEFYRITIDREKAAIVSLYDKELGIEAVDSASEWRLGELIYEKLPTRDELNAFYLDNYKRSGMSHCTIKEIADGPVCKSVVLEGVSEGTDSGSVVRMEIKLYKGVKRIEMEYSLRRLPEIDPSAFYVAFPWKLDNGRLSLEVQGGVLYPGINQLPGTTTAWYTAQNFVSACDSVTQFIVGSDAVPLYQMGNLLGGPFEYEKTYEKPYVYSWVMNNYWFTNFRPKQEGEFRWSYYLTSTDDTANSKAAKFGWGSRVPLYARVMPVGEVNNKPSSYSAFSISPDNLLMTSCSLSESDGSLLLNIRELDGKAALLKVVSGDGTLMEIEEVNAVEETQGRKTMQLDFEPFENKFIRLKIKE